MRRSMALLALVFLAACGTSIGSETLGPYAGDPYIGAVQVRIVPPDGSPIRDTGTASAQIVDEGEGRARLILVGNIKENADAGFAIDGVYDASGWRAEADGVQLRIGADGAISGGGAAPPQRFRFEGAVTRGVFELETELELLERNGNLPAGTKFVFSYRLQRAAAGEQDAASAPRTSAGREDCKRIVWRTRHIAGFGGGPMQMIQVPECVRR
ncbi:hypothetical protein H0E84_10405 [Luteimonas sp. SJ-92]|uniref:Lipoprotein n=1 Tax=Luteimonas salinisoli TaxID=2752307 RepID=A0A853JD83_9GAMM|nr:hypothetical protein [Luteimonas salinisoli]NZA26795.1 hypothetical protein [Luteimonas salinisoli]